jgi:large subunit ribosomal protein L29
MASVVELRETSSEKIEEMLENAREELFNLRFQHASARLEDVSRLKMVRREIAQFETVLNMRQQAIDEAVKQEEIVAAIGDKYWFAEAHFQYEDSAWLVEFFDEEDEKLAATFVDLNKKKEKTRRARRG